MNVLKSAISGEYDIIGNPSEADCIIGQAFGTAENGPGYVNELLAKYILEETNINLPLLLQKEITDALPKDFREIELNIDGDLSNISGGGLDSWSALKQAREYMHEHGLKTPILVAQAHHIGRVCMQAIKIGMSPIIPGNLPQEFDPKSTQPWTRNRELWVLREVPGIAYLKLRQKL